MLKNIDSLFRNFIAAEVYEPKAEWARLYDMDHGIIWINTAAEESNNVVKLSPAKW